MTKQELKDYRHLRAEIRQLDGQIAYWRRRAEGGNRAPDRSPVVGHFTDPLPYIMDKIIACEQARDEKTKRLADVEAAFAMLDAREARLMRAYYVEGKTWEAIAVDFSYTWRHVHRLHADALKKMSLNVI